MSAVELTAREIDCVCDSFSLWKVAMDRALNSDPIITADTEGRML